MYVINLLDENELTEVKKLFSELNFLPGQIKSGLNEKIKHCKSADLNHPSYKVIYEYFSSIFPKKQEISTIYSFKDITIPYPVRYSDGMFYEYHIDELEINKVRSDYSMTLFLTEPEEYDGGELILKKGDLITPVKLRAGQAILYDTDIVHKVNTVTKGNRDVVLFWAESIFKDKQLREHCVNLAKTISYLAKNDDDQIRNSARELEQSRINLMRTYANI
jgi:PKHD-type hydroxylase